MKKLFLLPVCLLTSLVDLVLGLVIAFYHRVLYLVESDDECTSCYAECENHNILFHITVLLEIKLCCY